MPPTVAQPPGFPPATTLPGTPPPGIMPPVTSGPPMTAPPPSAVRLIAPLEGQWLGAGNESGVATRQWLTLNPDGTFVNYAQYSVGQVGFVIQSRGRYTVFAQQPQTGFLTIDIQGYQPQQTCSSVGCRPIQMAPQANIQFSLIDPNTMRAQLGASQSNLTRAQPVPLAPPAAPPPRK